MTAVADRTPDHGLMTGSLAAFFTTLAATGSAREASMAAGAGPLATLAQQALTELSQWRRRSVEGLLDEAARQLDTTPDVLLDEAMGREDARELLMDAVVAATETINEQKVSALAKALANGVQNDRARIDESRLVVRALADLEAPHIKLLARVVHRAESFSVPEIAELMDSSAPSAINLIATMQRHGLLRTDEESRSAAAASLAKRAGRRSRLLEAGGGADFSDDVYPDWHTRRDEPTWLPTGFASLCWDYLLNGDDAASGTSP